jgi:AcrR family transcriptional regulator
MTQQDAKERILQAATQLIEESGGGIEEITTRAIADRAQVGIGLINYHFQTKENLIEICVQQLISGVIAQFKPQPGQAAGGPAQLAAVVKLVADFLMDNQPVSQISILGDYKNPKPLDNTMKTAYGFTRSLGDYDMTDDDKKLLAFALTSVLQAMFLRRQLSAELFGCDFNNKAQRDSFIDFIVARLFERR